MNRMGVPFIVGGWFAVVGLALAPLLALGQVPELGSGLNLTLLPEIPGPFTRVEARLESFATDLDRAEITWVLDGKVAAQGTGHTDIAFTTGDVGSETTLAVSVKTFDGRFLNDRLSLRPGTVSLLAEARSYTPPFYRGRALLPIRGAALVVATPRLVTASGERVAPDDVIYTWRQDGKVVGSASGRGKRTLAVRGKIPIRAIAVEVDATAPEFGVGARGATVLTPVPPSLILYEDHPRYGLRLERALNGGFTLEEDEVRVAAVPYFFETTRRDGGGLTYEWSANYEPAGEGRSALALRRTSAKGGEATVALTARKPERVFQLAEARTAVALPERVGFPTDEASASAGETP